MAEAVYLSPGDMIDHTPSAAVSAGEVVVQGDLLGVAPMAIAASAKGAIAVEGVFSVAKTTGTGEAFTAGAKVYFDATNNVAINTDASGTHKLLGKAVAAAADAATTVTVKLTQ